MPTSSMWHNRRSFGVTQLSSEQAANSVKQLPNRIVNSVRFFLLLLSFALFVVAIDVWLFRLQDARL